MKTVQNSLQNNTAVYIIFKKKNTLQSTFQGTITCMCVYVQVYTFIHVCMYTYVCIYINIHICVYIFLHILIYVQEYIYTNVFCVFLNICVCIYVPLRLCPPRALDSPFDRIRAGPPVYVCVCVCTYTCKYMSYLDMS